MMEQVILVDEKDNETGVMPKLEAHQKGILHRAFSVFIFNSKGELLLQQRALNKYHSAGLWSNTCCSHPLPGESINDAANRRLAEEMGLSCKIYPAFSFIYKADLYNDLVEHEYDHVFIGTSDAVPVISKDEVAQSKYIDVQSLTEDMIKNPSTYTAWLRICFERVVEYNGKSSLPVIPTVGEHEGST